MREDYRLDESILDDISSESNQGNIIDAVSSQEDIKTPD